MSPASAPGFFGWLRAPFRRPAFLTKSDFKIARDCPSKLYYKKQRYPSLLADNPYLAFLADGGYMVETMARALFPNGREIGDWNRPEDAHRATLKALSQDGVTLFEATILEAPFQARIDILHRQGSVLKLIEVKSVSADLGKDSKPFRGQRGGIEAAWRPYLEDVTYQALLLERVCPGFEVRPFLCVVDKSKVASAAVTFDRFRLVPPPAGQPLARATFEYVGDPDELRRDHLLALVDASAEMAELREEVSRESRRFAESLASPEPIRIPGGIGRRCKSCEYRGAAAPGEPDGFAECWGNLAGVQPHILDLYRLDLLGGGRSRDLAAELAARGSADWDSIPADAFHGKAAERQRIQIECTRTGQEWKSPALRSLLEQHPYPLHFIDFETSRLALPYHAGMHPYEQVGFQWSCHTIREPGAPIEHSEWLNSEDAFPNFEFARSLMQQVDRAGTVYIWSPFENTMLREIRGQMERYRSLQGAQDADLAAWLEDFLAGKDDWVIDLCALARDHYFHPDMKGSVSIKKVFPAVWCQNPAVQELPIFRRFQGSQDPYQSLPSERIGDAEEVVQEGTGAIRIYQEMMFGLSRDHPQARSKFRQLLLQYCHLDTAAMVAIWWHWMGNKGPVA